MDTTPLERSMSGGVMMHICIDDNVLPGSFIQDVSTRTLIKKKEVRG